MIIAAHFKKSKKIYSDLKITAVTTLHTTCFIIYVLRIIRACYSKYNVGSQDTEILIIFTGYWSEIKCNYTKACVYGGCHMMQRHQHVNTVSDLNSQLSVKVFFLDLAYWSADLFPQMSLDFSGSF